MGEPKWNFSLNGK